MEHPTMSSPVASTPVDSTPDPYLHEITDLSMKLGCALMETGAPAHAVVDDMQRVAAAFGLDRLHLLLTYGALSATGWRHGRSVTLVRQVGAIGVNHRLMLALRRLGAAVVRGEVDAPRLRPEIDFLQRATPRHPAWVVAVGVGIACAAFGRLLGTDWAAFAPILVAAAVAQAARHALARRALNPFLNAAFIAFLAATLGGSFSHLAHSTTVPLAMIASVLLLVPGVPALNAQSDLIHNRPVLGGARITWVVTMLLFVALGLAAARELLSAVLPEVLPVAGSPTPATLASTATPAAAVPALTLAGMAHHAAFGGIAAAGFGLLFNMAAGPLAWAFAAGAIALAVRTYGLAQPWSLEASSFVAALAVGVTTRFFRGFHGMPGTTHAVAGCIPMVPGAVASRALLAAFAITAPHGAQPFDVAQTIAEAVGNGLRLAFTLGAIGTGVIIPMLLLDRLRPVPAAASASARR
jgi:uncharacterized membrane protein YjjP (DUF1212 family)